jgi:hypothetical protein
MNPTGAFNRESSNNPSTPYEEEQKMNETQRNKWNTDKLAELYPPFGERISAIVTELESHGLRPRIQEAWRSEADQLKAFNSKHSQLKYGFHNVTGAKGKKEALAIDMVDDSLVNNKKVEYSYAEYLLRLTAAAEKQGLVSGIRWGLEEGFAAAIDAIENAIAKEDWKVPLKHFGWDPGHIQPRDITPEDAKKGKRPFIVEGA